jgi:uncharacterized protein
MNQPHVIGVISDTHGLLRPEAVQAMQSSELIIHAGDVGKPEILDGLRKIAPVKAIRGNVDAGIWAQGLPQTRTVEFGGVRIFVIHNIDDLSVNAAAAGYVAVISGHSHTGDVMNTHAVSALLALCKSIKTRSGPSNSTMFSASLSSTVVSIT